MLLAIDIGNTNIYIGLWNLDIHEWRNTWRSRTVHDKMPDEYATLIQNFLGTANLTYTDVHNVILSSVVPKLTQSFIEMCHQYMHTTPLVVTHETTTGIEIDVDHPQQVGADRIVNAAASAALYGGPAVIVDFGTATTFDVLSEDKRYCGGAITTGIHLSMDVLVQRSALLHQVDLQPPPSSIGRNTIQAMQSGLFWGYVAMLEGIIARIKHDMTTDQEIQTIATGGLVSIFSQHTDCIDTVDLKLTLEGLRIIYELNSDHS